MVKNRNYLWALLAGSVISSYVLQYFVFYPEYSQIVEIGNGPLRGSKSRSRGGRVFTEFRGIPYAKPPVGDLRFRSPLPAENWTNVYTADRGSIECIQIEVAFTFRIQGQEDCLYLNVFTPKQFDINDGGHLLPVIVFIHGGGFISGSMKDYGGNYFMDEDIVLVTLNYRLGALGFLNTGDKSARGNMGLKDQQLALRWVQQNIHAFGGDSNRVTLMGESAGASSVHLHMLSPNSRGLFHKGMMLSGNALPSWSRVDNPVEQSQHLAQKFLCNGDNSRAVINCLRNVDALELAAAHSPNRYPMVDPIETYGPSIEKLQDRDTFLSESPEKLMRDKKFAKLPIIMGLNRGEGLVYAARIIQDVSQAERLKNKTEWNESLPRLLALDKLQAKSAHSLTNFYFPTGDSSFDPLSQIENITNLYSDRMFHYYHEKFLDYVQNAWTEDEAPLYSYYYTYTGFFNVFRTIMYMPTQKTLPAEVHLALSFLSDYFLNLLTGDFPYKNVPSPCHGDEMALLFDLGYVFTITETSEDYQMSKSYVKMIADFATGNGKNLQFHGRHWPTVQSQREKSVMRLDLKESSALISAPYEERLRLWGELNVTNLF